MIVELKSPIVQQSVSTSELTMLTSILSHIVLVSTNKSYLTKETVMKSYV